MTSNNNPAAENGEIFTVDKPKRFPSTGADFETAISAAGFGKFNFILYLTALIATWSSIFETTTMSYVFPAAQCDLDLSLGNKGVLNAITYAGMISSGFLWGFLCDTLGRKKLLVAGFFLDAIFVYMSATSQNFYLLMTAKFFGGFFVTGPFSALTSYLSEFHCAKYRARVQMVLGIGYSCANLILPLLAWAILPLPHKLIINDFVLHSWNFYLFIAAIPSTFSCITFMFLPESPKFLMTTGRNQKALEVFRKVYSLNTGKPSETYPVTELVDEIKMYSGNHVTANRTKKQAMKEGWQQIAPLFKPPHLSKIVLVCAIQMMLMMSLNTLRLWLPQIFQAINDYQAEHEGKTNTLCSMLEVLKPLQNTTVSDCVVNLDNSEVYLNSMIVAMTTILGYIVAGSLINILGKKKLLSTFGFFSGTMAISIYFAQDTATTIALSSLFITLGSISVNVVLAIVVDLFPTTYRTMCVSLAMMMGRVGAMSGNLVFPLLLQTGCAPPFFTLGSIMIVCSALVFVFPNTDMKPLQ